ncbi:MAG: CRISPR-associated endonuclease Cas3'' [Pyrobaculum sp.]|jgi:CRISPR-associated endonuclease Cas3-HD
MSADCLAGPGEPLGQHLLEVACCVRREGKAVALKIAKSFGLRPEEARDLLFYAALMHDAGKADVKYSDDSGYYPFHEAKSVAVIYKALRELGLAGSCKPSDSPYSLLLLSVALHHYSHKRYNRAESASFKKRCDAVEEALRAWKPESELGEKIRQKTLEVLSAGVPGDICFGVLATSLKRAATPPRTRKAAMAVLGILNKCDIQIAKARRRQPHGGE